MPTKFGPPGSLVRFNQPKGMPGPIVAVATDFPVWDQGEDPTCTSAAALGALAGFYSLRGERLGDVSLAYTYLGSEQIISSEDVSVEVEDQLRAGVPLAAAMESVRRFGVVRSSAFGGGVEEIANAPVALAKLLKSQDQTLEDLRKESATLLRPAPRAVRLFPTEENIVSALSGKLLVPFSFRIDASTDEWMSSRELQEGTGFVLPSPSQSTSRVATHACLITAFDSEARLFTVRNSFGPQWGRAGDFYVPSSTIFASSFSGSDFFAFM
jgi:hypothetical protein